MTAHNQKYLEPSQPYPHIGQMMAKRMAEARISQADVARRLNINPSAVARYAGQESVQVGIVWKMGLALGHNFFAELSDAFPLQPPTTEVEARIAELEKELAIYKNIVMAGRGQ